MRWVLTIALLTAVGLACGAEAQADPRHAGLSSAWLIFGFGAQGLFFARMLVQWVASERARASIVPPAFWWISLAGGICLMIYFLRRGDPVGWLGQLGGILIYVRNLAFIRRLRKPETGGAPSP